MAFISDTNKGQTYSPGHFLAHEECERETREIPQTGATTAANGGKYHRMGEIWPSNDGDAVGILYEDVDVTNGNMPGSVVVKGKVILDRLPETIDDDARTALAAKGFTFVDTEADVTRPY